jgi:Family of unknown function (DUF6491)
MRCACFSLLLAAFLVGPVAAQADDAVTPKHDSCFYVTQFEDWRAQDAKTINIRVGLNRYYRLDLASECREALWPGSHLTMNVRGPDTICSAIDWDLRVSQDMHSIPTACIVKSMTELSPAEAAAIPKKFKP